MGNSIGSDSFVKLFSTNQFENSDIENAKTNQIIVGGTTKIVMNEDQFNELKKAMDSVRNKLAGSDV